MGHITRVRYIPWGGNAKFSNVSEDVCEDRAEGSLLRFTGGANDETSKFPSPAFTHLIVVAEAPFITGVESGEWRGKGKERSRKCSLIAS